MATPPRPAPLPTYTPHDRAERLIANGRVMLATVSLLAITRDPTEPARHAVATYALLGLYLFYAAALWVALRRVRPPLRPFSMPIHAFDLAFFTLLMYLTEGPTSPFVVYLTFTLVAGTIRGQRAGAWWTGLAALGVFLALGAYAGWYARAPDFEFNRFAIRAVYLAVIAIMLGSLGGHEARWRREWRDLADWPIGVARDSFQTLELALAHAAGLAEARGALLVWEDPEEPRGQVAQWTASGLKRWEEDLPLLAQAFSGDLAGVTFWTRDAAGDGPVLVWREGEGPGYRAGPAIAPALAARWRIQSVLGAPLPARLARARLLLLGRRDATSDDLVLARTIAGRLAGTLDELLRSLKAEYEAGLGERLRVARDLHDDVLQSLSGVGMQVGALAATLPQEPGAVREGLAGIQRLVLNEQRKLRFFVAELRGGPPDVGAPLRSRLEGLGERVRSVWGLAVELTVDVPDAAVPAGLQREVYRLVQEALVNAARHAQASRVVADLRWSDGALRITVADDGRGFPFQGCLDHETLQRRRLGPFTLKERVAALGGRLTIESSPRGATVTAVLPAAEAIR